MKPEERGAYWQLICWQMQSDDGHLPENIRLLSVLADLELHPQSCVVEAFPIQENGKRANARALKEWRNRITVGESRSNAASIAANKRWHPKGMRQACVAHTKGNASECTATSTATSTPTGTSRDKENVKIRCGESKNVLLTDQEIERLLKDYGNQESLKQAIDILDAYIENNPKGRKYKSHVATLRKNGGWVYDKWRQSNPSSYRRDQI
jgi:hypothetical protein